MTYDVAILGFAGETAVHLVWDKTRLGAGGVEIEEGRSRVRRRSVRRSMKKKKTMMEKVGG